MIKKSKKVVFKEYTPNQSFLFPPAVEDFISPEHPVRIVNNVIDSINIDALIKQYDGGGASSFHPRMLLKVLVYGYLCNTYSSRKIEASIKENVHFMWLGGMHKPDHNTINRFRSDRLKNVLKEVFSQVVKLLVASGHVSLKEVYIDGTKIEANANRYTFVWGKSIENNKKKMEQQLKELWEYAETIAAKELADTCPLSFAPVDKEQVRKTIEQIDAALKDKEVTKKVKQKLSYAKKHWPENIEKYNQQQQVLQGRNSYAKTDTDATFMRMKEDHMKNGQLKPGYNLQLATQDQFIVNYSIHHNPTDTTTLPSHLNHLETSLGVKPQSVTTDAGYGSEENYDFLQQKDITAYVKYNYFDKDQRSDKNPFHVDNLYYNEQADCVYCPMGQPMNKTGDRNTTTENGYQQTSSLYQAQNCTGCPLPGMCHKAKGNRIVQINHRLRAYKQKAKALLNSEEGIKHRKKRCHDVEPVFANIKHNKGFKRFMLRGKEKVEIETGLIALAHNLAKMAA
jgi:transposase